MKKTRIGLFVLVLVIIAIAIMFVLCNKGDPVVKTITAKDEEETVQYSIIYDNGKQKQTDEFIPDKAVFLYADADDFSLDIKDGNVFNSLNSTKLMDANGEEVEGDAVTMEMMQCAADSIDHDIFEFTVIVDKSSYFAFVKLNVNWQDPCILYQYDSDSKELNKLYQWDGVDLIGISIK